MKCQSAVIHTEAEPGVRYSSGLTVCDEALRNGHWINRYWLATGMIQPEFHLEGEKYSGVAPLADAYELSIEGQDLGGGWKGGRPTRSRSRNRPKVCW